MTENASRGMTQGFKAEIFIEIAPPALLPRNDGILDGILEFSVMRSSGQAR